MSNHSIRTARHDNLDFQTHKRHLLEESSLWPLLAPENAQPTDICSFVLERLDRGNMEGITRQLLQSSTNASTVSFPHQSTFFATIIVIEFFEEKNVRDRRKVTLFS